MPVDIVSHLEGRSHPISTGFLDVAHQQYHLSCLPEEKGKYEASKIFSTETDP